MPTPAEIIGPHLDLGERLLWSGRPRQGFVLRPIDLLLFPFSLTWGGFAIFWEYTALTGITRSAGKMIGFMFPLFGSMFAVAGLYLIFGRFLADRYYRAHLAYGLTDHRAIIVSEALWGSVTSHELDTLSGVRLVERRSGRGTVHLGSSPGSVFGQMNGFGPWHAALGQAPMFFEIEKPKEVMALLRRNRHR